MNVPRLTDVDLAALCQLRDSLAAELRLVVDEIDRRRSQTATPEQRRAELRVIAGGAA